jgi:hypothetical protein
VEPTRCGSCAQLGVRFHRSPGGQVAVANSWGYSRDMKYQNVSIVIMVDTWLKQLWFMVDITIVNLVDGLEHEF